MRVGRRGRNRVVRGVIFLGARACGCVVCVGEEFGKVRTRQIKEYHESFTCQKLQSFNRTNSGPGGGGDAAMILVGNRQKQISARLLPTKESLVQRTAGTFGGRETYSSSSAGLRLAQHSQSCICAFCASCVRCVCAAHSLDGSCVSTPRSAFIKMWERVAEREREQ